VKFQGARFAISRPADWQPVGDSSTTVTLAPVGGASATGLGYGAMIGLEKQAGNGVMDAASLAAATAALAQKFNQENGGLEQVSQTKVITVGGQPANVVELRGRSPVGEGGKQFVERDRLLTVERSDGDLSYVVFVCPEPDLALLKPLFDTMAASFRAQ